MSSFVGQELVGLVQETISKLPALTEDDRASTVTDLALKVKEVGYLGWQSTGAMAALKQQLNQKDVGTTLNALSAVKAICEDCEAWIEPSMIELIPDILVNYQVRQLEELTHETSRSLARILSGNSLKIVLPVLFGCMDHIKWQIRRGAMLMLGDLALAHPKPMGLCLPEVILKLIEQSSDSKKQIKETALEVFPQVCTAIDNIDIQPIIPAVIQGYCNPLTETLNALDRLVATTFVNDIDTPTLALLVPILTRAMREKKVVFKRRSALVMENMCKLVTDPRDAGRFFHVLEPVLVRGIEEIQVEEVRNVCQSALNTLRRVMSEAVDKTAQMLTREEIVQILKNNITQHAITEAVLDPYTPLLTYISTMCHSIIEAEIMEDDLYMASCVPYISAILPKEQAVLVAEEVTARCKECITVREVDPEEDEEDLCDATFSLAYGTRVLLHQTPFKVKRGRKYGLCGPNGAGKSTLMRAIANKNLQGFPEEINSVYVEHDIQGSHADTPVWQYVFDDEKVRTYDISEQKIREALSVVGFTEEMQNGPVAALSGGWRMKLALSRAMLLNPDMLLLDEPTNHLDQFAVRWLTEYIQNLTTCTCLLVSHDTRFLDAVCTNIIHYENLKLKTYRGNLSDFVRQKPEARAYYELASENTRFSFPEPGRLEGVKSLTKAVLKTTDISFQYPSAPQPQLQNVSIQCSLASRVAVIGVNGAGKSTLVKIMVGELKPDRGEVYRHPNLRIAYVAQHAFHHIDQHFDKTPVEYVMWRYSGGVDKEQVNLETRKMSEEEEKKLQDDAKRNKTFVIERLVGRRMGKREHEFEVEWQGGVRENSYVARSELEAMGYQKMIQECDERVAMEAMAGQRLLITGEIQRHFDGFGLEPQFAQHTPIKALSGGQKVKVVLGASLWNLPHIVILDEPTNFLDRDSLGALAGAIREFKGGIFMISHNAEFYEALCPERWLLNEGRLTVQGSEWMAEVEAARLRREKEAKKKLPVQEEDKYDSLGNKVDKQEKKKASELSRAEKKRLQKLRKEMIKNGQETFEIDELLGVV